MCPPESSAPEKDEPTQLRSRFEWVVGGVCSLLRPASLGGVKSALSTRSYCGRDVARARGDPAASWQSRRVLGGVQMKSRKHRAHLTGLCCRPTRRRSGRHASQLSAQSRYPDVLRGGLVAVTPVVSRSGSKLEDDPAVRFLLGSREPGIRYQVLTEVLGRPDSDPEAVAARAGIMDGPKISGIFASQQPDGSWSDFPYRKWTGTHHVLRRLLDLGCPGDDQRVRLALERDIEWLPDARRKGGGAGGLEVIDGRVRWHVGAFEGVTLASWCGFGYADDPRVR